MDAGERDRLSPMPVTLADLAEPAATAVLTCELQRGIVGDLTIEPMLRDAVTESGILVAAGRLVRAARGAGARVVHATYGVRADGLGVSMNTRAIASAFKHGQLILDGTAQTEVVPEVGCEPEDVVCHRIHGYTPFTGTELDPLLRNMGVRTIVAVGISLNECVLGACLSAADLGYRVVVPTDAVVGIPAEYGELVLRHSLAMVATLTTVDELVDAWT